jgi:hypothetical protein
MLRLLRLLSFRLSGLSVPAAHCFRKIPLFGNSSPLGSGR